MGQTQAVELSANASVAQLREQIDLDASLNLQFGGVTLKSGLLADFGIEEESTLFVNAELLGGGKKRKKKVYKTPKKIKHKKKKVKLAVLKFYKVTRLRKECPNCGPGVFMAIHYNRYYCGKCGL